MTSDTEQSLQDASLWDRAAATFDDEPDHGLRDPAVRRAWVDLLAKWLPPAPASLLDIGCGTGSLSLVMAELGHKVTGIDQSPAMIARAADKTIAAGQQVNFRVMDAVHPQLLPQRFDGIVCRHVLWALPEPACVLERWTEMLAPDGSLILIEGYWNTGASLKAGLRAREILDLLPPGFMDVFVQDLSEQPGLWGRAVTDERYLVIAR